MTGIALAAAMLAAVCVALASSLQHRAVRAVLDGDGRRGGRGPGGTGGTGSANANRAGAAGTAVADPVAAGPPARPAPRPGHRGSGGTVTPRRLRAIATRPVWLTGLGFSVAGGVLHTVALGLAPLPVVQPVGALAVPVAVLLTAHAARRRPPPVVWAGVALAACGVVAVVALSAGGPEPGPLPAGRLPWAVAAAALATGAFVLVAARPGRGRPLACAAGAAVAFGTESVLLRAVARILGGQPAAPEALPLLLACAAGALVAGCWLVQQAYASGPPEAVVAALTVLDPIVAVGLAAVALGEGTHAHPAGLLAAAALATAGVLALARHHPDQARA